MATKPKTKNLPPWMKQEQMEPEKTTAKRPAKKPAKKKGGKC